MPAPTACPNCGTLRAPNGRYCHVCGRAYEQSEPGLSQPSQPRQSPDDRLTVGDGFRFGIGFFVAAILFAIVSTILSTLLFAGIFGQVLRTLGQ